MPSPAAPRAAAHDRPNRNPTIGSTASGISSARRRRGRSPGRRLGIEHESVAAAAPAPHPLHGDRGDAASHEQLQHHRAANSSPRQASTSTSIRRQNLLRAIPAALASVSTTAWRPTPSPSTRERFQSHTPRGRPPDQPHRCSRVPTWLSITSAAILQEAHGARFRRRARLTASAGRQLVDNRARPLEHALEDRARRVPSQQRPWPMRPSHLHSCRLRFWTVDPRGHHGRQAPAGGIAPRSRGPRDVNPQRRAALGVVCRG